MRHGKHKRSPRHRRRLDFEPATILIRAAQLAAERRSCCLRLPRDLRVSMALAAAGVDVWIDEGEGLAHVFPRGSRR